MKRLNISGIEKGKHTNKGETKIFKIQILRNHFDLNNIVIDTTNNENEDMKLDNDGM